VLRREDGYTLIELLAVFVIISILSLIAVSFHRLGREQAGDATARTNIRIAIPAFEAYRVDHGSYEGMTMENLQSSYSPGVQGVEILSTAAAGYCVRSMASGRTWYKNGPAGELTTTACA
jgi:prepilin-type N-terminal cleavage/methylation domain-containing protein